jgi:5-oxoprolinase (ATP-hydrolysing)
LIIDNTQTILVEPASTVYILSSYVVIQNGVAADKADRDISVVNPVQLSVFGHRFMSIAEQVSLET